MGKREPIVHKIPGRWMGDQTGLCGKVGYWAWLWREVTCKVCLKLGGKS